MEQRRVSGLAAVAAAVTLVLGACAGPGSTGEAQPGTGTGDWGDPKGTIEFWDTNANPRLSAEWDKLIARFETANPDIDVKYVGLPNSSYLQKVNNALATGQVPDVLLIGNDVASLIAQKALAPLDAAVTKAGLAAKLDPKLVENERRNSADKALYKLPLSALSDVIWYRTDWLKTAGLKEPTSYDEFFATAKALTKPGSNQFGYAFRGGPGAMPPMFAMTYGMSGVGEFFGKDGQATLDKPENVAAFKKYISLYGTVSAKADLSNDYAKIVAEFDGGSAWATHHNLGSYQDHLKTLGAANVAGVQPFPNSAGVITATSPAVSGLGVLAKSKHKAAAWKFAEFMSTDANSDWAQTVGQVPASLEAQTAAWIGKAQPLTAIVETAKNPKTQYLQLPTYLPDWGSILKTEMEPDFQSVLQGKLSPEDFLGKYANRFEKAQAEYVEHAGK